MLIFYPFMHLLAPKHTMQGSRMVANAVWYQNVLQ